MPLDIQVKKSIVTICPLRDIAHYIQIENDQFCRTGLPFMLLGDSEDEVLDLAYSSYEVNHQIATGTLRDIDWLVNYTEEEANATLDNINTFDIIMASPIKHPSKDEWAIPYNDYVFSKLPAGAIKTAMEAGLASRTADGHRKTKAEMISDGWV